MPINKATLLNWVVSKRHFCAHTNIEYDSQQGLHLDVFTPRHTPHPLPVLLFVHGGAWSSSSKDDYVFIADSLCRAGIVVVIGNYRLAPQHQYPSFVYDTANMVHWVQQHIAQYHGDASHIFVMGHSAGAFNVIRAFAQDMANPQLNMQHIRAIIGLAGPYYYNFKTDTTAYVFPDHLTVDAVMPAAQQWSSHQPLPPHYLLTAERDTLVGINNAQRMLHHLKQSGHTVQHIHLPRVDHVGIVAALAMPLRFLGNTRQHILDIIKTHSLPTAH